jgi:hypothetical protein
MDNSLNQRALPGVTDLSDEKKLFKHLPASHCTEELRLEYRDVVPVSSRALKQRLNRRRYAELTAPSCLP